MEKQRKNERRRNTMSLRRHVPSIHKKEDERRKGTATIVDTIEYTRRDETRRDETRRETQESQLFWGGTHTPTTILYSTTVRVHVYVRTRR